MKRIAIFGSGRGSNAKNIIKYFKFHKNISIKLMVTNKSGAGIVTVGKENKIPTLIIEDHKQDLNDKILKTLTENLIDFVVLAGFLLKIPSTLINKFPNCIINIHPALLPKYGGKGMYGINVHKAVLKNNETVSGITIHFVNEDYDKGEIIFQAKCSVLPNDSPKLLSKKIQKLEHQFYPIIIEKLITNEH